MNKLKLLILFLAITLQGCSNSGVDAGVEGVMVMKPWIFGSGGTADKPIKNGSEWTALTTSVIHYNVKPRKYKERFVDLTASDKVDVDFDIYVTLKIKNNKSPGLHDNHGVNWYENNVRSEFRAFVRAEAKKQKSEDLRSNQHSISTVTDSVFNKTKVHLDKIGIMVDIIAVNLGGVRPPDEVMREAALTASEKQRALTQVQKKLAEDARAEAEKSTALADKAYTDQFKMTTEQFLINKRLDITRFAVEKASEKGDFSLIMNNSDAKPIFKVK